ncbi:unnamed protein product [Pleuronectes platessa]|uniref:Sushi domain-containing protein n=1 Tax=Pleuronectes platessa TaxID=8262 RepID=A0A9N7YYL8_PLEPL|nr:unnamed protein product [Pleuronectes platessa]
MRPSEQRLAGCLRIHNDFRVTPGSDKKKVLLLHVEATWKLKPGYSLVLYDAQRAAVPHPAHGLQLISAGGARPVHGSDIPLDLTCANPHGYCRFAQQGPGRSPRLAASSRAHVPSAGAQSEKLAWEKTSPSRTGSRLVYPVPGTEEHSQRSAECGGVCPSVRAMSAATASVADVSRTDGTRRDGGRRQNNSGQAQAQCTLMPLPALGTQKIIQGNGTNVGTVISLQCPAKHKLVGRGLRCVMDVNSTHWDGENYCAPLAPYEGHGFRVAVLASIVSSAIILLMSMAFITCCLLDCMKEDKRKKQER